MRNYRGWVRLLARAHSWKESKDEYAARMSHLRSEDEDYGFSIPGLPEPERVELVKYEVVYRDLTKTHATGFIFDTAESAKDWAATNLKDKPILSWGIYSRNTTDE